MNIDFFKNWFKSPPQVFPRTTTNVPTEDRPVQSHTIDCRIICEGEESEVMRFTSTDPYEDFRQYVMNYVFQTGKACTGSVVGDES